jgi:hypothetical protein
MFGLKAALASFVRLSTVLVGEETLPDDLAAAYQPDGERLPAEQAPMVRQWASQLYFIASQEMLHLAQAWNLLAALGGTPYYLRPNFPQNTKYCPLHLKLAFEPYGEA